MIATNLLSALQRLEAGVEDHSEVLDIATAFKPNEKAVVQLTLRGAVGARVSVAIEVCSSINFEAPTQIAAFDLEAPADHNAELPLFSNKLRYLRLRYAPQSFGIITASIATPPRFVAYPRAA